MLGDSSSRGSYLEVSSGFQKVAHTCCHAVLIPRVTPMAWGNILSTPLPSAHVRLTIRGNIPPSPSRLLRFSLRLGSSGFCGSTSACLLGVSNLDRAQAESVRGRDSLSLRLDSDRASETLNPHGHLETTIPREAEFCLRYVSSVPWPRDAAFTEMRIRDRLQVHDHAWIQWI